MSKKESKDEGAAAGSAAVDRYAPTGRGVNVVCMPAQAPKLRTTEENEVFQFLRKYDQHLEIIQGRRLAGENIQPVESIRCLAPGLNNKVVVAHTLVRAC